MADVLFDFCLGPLPGQAHLLPAGQQAEQVIGLFLGYALGPDPHHGHRPFRHDHVRVDGIGEVLVLRGKCPARRRLHGRSFGLRFLGGCGLLHHDLLLLGHDQGLFRRLLTADQQQEDQHQYANSFHMQTPLFLPLAYDRGGGKVFSFL